MSWKYGSGGGGYKRSYDDVLDPHKASKEPRRRDYYKILKERVTRENLEEMEHRQNGELVNASTPIVISKVKAYKFMKKEIMPFFRMEGYLWNQDEPKLLEELASLKEWMHNKG